VWIRVHPDPCASRADPCGSVRVRVGPVCRHLLRFTRTRVRGVGELPRLDSRTLGGAGRAQINPISIGPTVEEHCLLPTRRVGTLLCARGVVATLCCAKEGGGKHSTRTQASRRRRRRSVAATLPSRAGYIHACCTPPHDCCGPVRACARRVDVKQMVEDITRPMDARAATVPDARGPLRELGTCAFLFTAGE
jgi:hypothetical protein